VYNIISNKIRTVSITVTYVTVISLPKEYNNRM